MANEHISEADEWAAMLRREQSDSVRAGRLFVAACRSGNVDDFWAAVNNLALTVDGWRHAMRYIGKEQVFSEEIKKAFLTVWIEKKTLPQQVAHRPTMVKALRSMLPANYSGNKIERK